MCIDIVGNTEIFLFILQVTHKETFLNFGTKKYFEILNLPKQSTVYPLHVLEIFWPTNFYFFVKFCLR